MSSSDHDYDYQPRGARERRTDAALKYGRGKSKAEEPKKPRAQKSDRRRQLERGLNGDTAGGAWSRVIGYAIRASDGAARRVAREMLYALDHANALLVEDPLAAAGVVRLARHRANFVREPRRFAATGTTADEQLRRLAGHLFEQWSVPHWMDDAWRHDDDARHAWFIHVGAGKNLSTAPQLPYPFTKRMAHFAINAPRGLHHLQALRWGQLRGLDVPEELADEVVHTRLAGTLPDEPFWKSVVSWFAVHPEVIGHANVIIDYVFAQRIGDFAQAIRADFSMRGRVPDRLLADARDWHRALNRQRSRASKYDYWFTCGIDGFQPTLPPDAVPVPDELPSWRIVELLTTEELESEGESLHHCVATYAYRAAAGESAIYSLRRNVAGQLKSSVTIEVWPAQRAIVQARGLQNAFPNSDDRKLIETWAEQRGLSIGAFVFGVNWPMPRRHPRAAARR
ncbi:MAG: PcfJ domain-containing protein [Tepidisphaeraceae bacterium]